MRTAINKKRMMLFFFLILFLTATSKSYARVGDQCYADYDCYQFEGEQCEYDSNYGYDVCVVNGYNTYSSCYDDYECYSYYMGYCNSSTNTCWATEDVSCNWDEETIYHQDGTKTCRVITKCPESFYKDGDACVYNQGSESGSSCYNGCYTYGDYCYPSTGYSDPTCGECPQYATCDGYEATCSDGFVAKTLERGDGFRYSKGMMLGEIQCVCEGIAMTSDSDYTKGVCVDCPAHGTCDDSLLETSYVLVSCDAGYYPTGDVPGYSGYLNEYYNQAYYYVDCIKCPDNATCHGGDVDEYNMYYCNDGFVDNFDGTCVPENQDFPDKCWLNGNGDDNSLVECSGCPDGWEEDPYQEMFETKACNYEDSLCSQCDASPDLAECTTNIKVYNCELICESDRMNDGNGTCQCFEVGLDCPYGCAEEFPTCGCATCNTASVCAENQYGTPPDCKNCPANADCDGDEDYTCRDGYYDTGSDCEPIMITSCPEGTTLSSSSDKACCVKD